MGIINKLDENTIDKIAAGEVVERPASVVKELVENAIDGGATSIVIEVEEGGKIYISVSDNGQGIFKEDVPLVFSRHATSKIKSLEDIYQIYSMGFRGEAMSSIGSIADVTLVTKHKTEEQGTMVHIKGGKILEEKNVGAPNGTKVEVRDIFFNTPARLKFMKSDLSEQNSIVDIVEKIALYNTLVSFKLIVDGKVVFQTPGNGDILAAIHTIYGKTKAKSMILLEYLSEKIQIEGYISKPELTKGNATDIIFAVNHRVIKNRSLVEAVKQAYKTILMNNKFPLCFLNISISPGDYDVNVHPAKAEIKFNDDRAMFNSVYIAIKNTLNNNYLIHDIDQIQNIKKDVQPEEDIIQTELAMEVPTNSHGGGIVPMRDPEKIKTSNSIQTNEIKLMDKNTEIKEILNTEVKEEASVYSVANIQIIGQLFNTYILCSDKDTYYMVDQHAAHERIIYENMTERMKNNNVLVQNLLMPIIIDLTSKEMGILLDNCILFGQMGFFIEQFGENSIKISSVPLLFGEPCSGAVINDLIENALEVKNNLEKIREKMLISMSCKSAIKAGDVLGFDEMKHLITELFKVKIPYTCPHGRPTVIRSSITEIEKKFKRIV